MIDLSRINVKQLLARAMSSTSARSESTAVEGLEERRLLSASVSGGVLSVYGSSDPEVIEIYEVGTDAYVDFDNVTWGPFPKANFNSVIVYAGNGADTVKQFLNLNSWLYGDGGYDTIWGGGGVDVISGGTGNDSLFGFGGNDELYGDDDNDYLSGGDGDDSLYGGDGSDELVGNDGDDYFMTWDGTGGNDVAHGGNGYDRLVSFDIGDNSTNIEVFG